MSNNSYYSSYLHSKHWYKLKKRLISGKVVSKCYICGSSSRLLVHHISYANLGKEVLGRDVVIVCFNCHEEIHFTPVFFFWRKKTPLKTEILLRRQFFLKSKKLIQSGKIIQSLPYILLWILI